MSDAPAASGSDAGPAVTSDTDEAVPYTMHSWSSYSANYHPRHVLEDQPSDQSSRWSSSSNQDQFITLRLQTPAIVKRIKFGKYTKVHVCNLKEFKIYGGLKPEGMLELLHSGLRNDSEAEVFDLVHVTEGVEFPVEYIKIVPLLAWGSRSGEFNYSIWHVALAGVTETSVVARALRSFQALQEKEAVRLCLKHFRQRNYMDSFEQLQKRTKVELEHPILTQLHDALVKEGDFAKCEELMADCGKKGLYTEHVSLLPYAAKWQRLSSADPVAEAADGLAPGMRGGHQMCIHSRSGTIYLLGGWEGHADLGDFWQYSIPENKWVLLSRDASVDGGPDPRSCHKMCINEERGQIYTLGRYVDQQMCRDRRLSADFFRYDIAEAKWVRLSNDTKADGGPGLIYDHQMCMDRAKNVIYVFGGRIIAQADTEQNHSYGGLYEYNCASGAWRLLREDMSTGPGHVKLRSRIGHSMLFNERERALYYFAGQRLKEYNSDFYKFMLDTGELVELSRDSSKQGGPHPGFTQRATIDCDQNEFYVLSGLVREPNDPKSPSRSAIDTVRNSLWIYNFDRCTWYCAYQNKCRDDASRSAGLAQEPCPRYAHQFVFDAVNKVHYLFGGNPGEPSKPKLRLADFWCLRLDRPGPVKINRIIKYLLRRQKFKEMCVEGAVEEKRSALRYLQEHLHAVVDHTDEQQSSEFRLLSSSLFQHNHNGPNIPTIVDLHEMRMSLYEQLLEFFPKAMTQPAQNLVDLVAFA